MPASPAERIRARAAALGFDAIGFARAKLPSEARTRLNAWLAAGHHGDMGWMETRAAERASPDTLWPEAVSVISLGVNYAPDENPLANLGRPDIGNISVYARNRDYHDLIRGRLKHLAQFVASSFGAGVKVFVDTAPLLEKPLAEQAGLGWQGKHSNLVSRDHGSWLFLGEILTTLPLPESPPAGASCGTCRACLDACPTAAFPQPYVLDARRCISYLTIEHAGPIPHEFRRAMGNRIYGCDDCLAVCPWNKFAATAREQKLHARDDLRAPALAELATLTDTTFRARFSGSPIKRIGVTRFLRNVLIAIGNSRRPELAGTAAAHTASPDPVVAEAAAWACAELAQC